MTQEPRRTPEGTGAAASGAPERLPATRPSGDAAGMLALPMERLAAAMQAQADILGKLHEGQQRTLDAIQDQRRSEMMITSTRALNESFHGMRRVQEKLLDRLAEKTGLKGRWLLVAALLVLVAAVVYAAYEIGRTVRETGKAVLDARPDAEVAGMIGSLDELKDRLAKVETADRDTWARRVEDLQGSLLELERDRRLLREERDALREQVGALKADAAGAATAREGLEERVRAAEAETARLTTRAIEDQRLLGELNRTIETLRARAGDPAATVASPREETAEAGGVTAPDAAGNAAPAGVETASAPEAAAPASATGPLPAPPALVAELNELLANHRGSEVYVLTRVEGREAQALLGVTLEVRGKDGSLSKTVEAARLAFALSPRSELLELEFGTGVVVFHQGPRTIRSPFFNDRYEIVILGVDSERWLNARHSFVRIK